MSKVVLISVASAVGLGLLSLHLVNRLKAGEATIADLKAQVAALQEQQQRSLPREATPPAEDIGPQPSEVIGTPPKAPPKLAGAVTAAAQVAPPGMPNRDERMRMFREQRERQRQLMQDPEYREAMRVQTRGNFARQYPGVIQELGLDPQQADAFFDLLADQQLRANEQMQPLWEMETDPSDQAAMQERNRKIQQMAQQNQRRNEAEIAAQLGSKVQAWKEYQSTMGVRYELENMRNTLVSNGLPISDDMSKPMLKALAQANQAEADEFAAANRGEPAAALGWSAGGSTSGSDSNNMERHLEMAKKRNQRMLDAISPYLSFEQRAAIERQQEAQLKMQEAQLRLMRSQSKAESNGVLFLQSSDVVVAQP
ncbi:hypothetical protein [Peristeroidobacter soli]|uniref:hypothetical protein n=1 Tax=Peristeroidobacter soli TaxID=2497877 RepID=UPI00101BBB12|nr:hypothetical protein [Peristeroidobacter soli]